MPLAGGHDNVLPVHVRGVQDFITSKMAFSGGSVDESIPQWHIDEFIGLNEFNQNYEYMGNGSSKVCSVLYLSPSFEFFFLRFWKVVLVCLTILIYFLLFFYIIFFCRIM